MEALIECRWDGNNGEPHIADAIVEYVDFIEDDMRVREIINIFLPEYVPQHWIKTCKQQIAEDFHARPIT